MTSPLNQLPDSSCGSTAGTVPVFNCIVILRKDPQTSRVTGRVANLPELAAEASSERDLLFTLTRRFREIIQTATKAGQPIAWKEPPDSPAPGELQRFIPVHL